MKRAVILLLLAALLLTGCGAKEAQPQDPYAHYVGNTMFMVDPAAMTITANGHVFTYSYIDEGNTRGVSVTYPNGAVITQSYEHSVDGVGALGGTSWSNADPDFIMNEGREYVDGNALLMVVPAQVQEEETVIMWFLIIAGIVTAALGVWLYNCPQVLWRWKYGWRYKNAEPSDTGLAVIMASGIINIILGVVLILIGIFA